VQPAKGVVTLEPLLPSTGDGSRRGEGRCPQRLRLHHTRRGCAQAGPGSQIAYMPAPSGYIQLDDSNLTLSGGFARSGGVIEATGSGRAVREQPIPVAGRYDFFIEGSFGARWTSASTVARWRASPIR